ncbi:MAG: hypothetical protein ACRYHQ_30625 [Janthinobacterium lividum]
MAQARMNIAVEGAGAVLSFLPGSGAEGALTFTADQLLEVIVGLGSIRAQLLGAQRPGLETNAVQAIIGPAWTVRPEAMTEGSMLAFAHPAYGTVGFVLVAADVQKMVRALTSHLGMVHSGEVGEARN